MHNKASVRERDFGLGLGIVNAYTWKRGGWFVYTSWNIEYFGRFESLWTFSIVEWQKRISFWTLDLVYFGGNWCVNTMKWTERATWTNGDHILVKDMLHFYLLFLSNPTSSTIAKANCNVYSLLPDNSCFFFCSYLFGLLYEKSLSQLQTKIGLPFWLNNHTSPTKKKISFSSNLLTSRSTLVGFLAFCLSDIIVHIK